MTASAQLDGRIDWYSTYAALVAQVRANSVPKGTSANTTDRGPVWSDGTNWVVASTVNVSGSDASVSYQVPLTGFSITVAAGVLTLNIEPAGTLASGAVIMPATPYDNQPITVMSTQAITALTVSPNSGQTLKGAPTSMAANSSFEYRYKASNATWYRKL
jgi:hypothetical protein